MKRKIQKKACTAGPDRTYIVKSILGHKLDNSKLYFSVSWRGYKNPTWEPMENLVNCILFRQYVNGKNASLLDDILMHEALVKKKLDGRINEMIIKPKAAIMEFVEPFDPFEYKVRLTFYHLVDPDEAFEMELEEEIIKNYFFKLDGQQRAANAAIVNLTSHKNSRVLSIENPVDFDDFPSFI
jgi:Chromo (CHRromatin Organisation MOdifier) domain